MIREDATADDSLLHGVRSGLDRHYCVLGRFYALQGTARPYPCRDMLELHRGEVRDTACDAIFVMMNPGSSRPLAGADMGPKHEAVLLPTKPDTTQYQLMRLMGVLGWKRVRVLNLSDLRNSVSAKFYEDVEAFERREGHDGHSIFSATRQGDLLAALARKPGAPIMAAWGVAHPLKEMAGRALAALDGMAVGLGHQRGPWAFFHPLPRNGTQQKQWRLDALRLLRPNQ